MQLNQYRKLKFHEAHLEIPQFAFLKYKNENLKDTKWWRYNPWIYIFEGDLIIQEFNPKFVVTDNDDESAIILFKGDVKTSLLSDYNYHEYCHDIIICGNIEAKNFIIDNDYFYIGGDVKVEELLIINHRSEMVVEGITSAKLGIARLDYALFSKNGTQFKYLISDECQNPKWDEPFPQSQLKNYLDSQYLYDYNNSQGMPYRWYSQLNILKIYEDLKIKSILKDPINDEFEMPKNEGIFNYKSINSKFEWQAQSENFIKLVNILNAENLSSIHFNLNDMRITYLKEFGRYNNPHFVIKIPQLGALTITYSNDEPNLFSKMIGRKEPEGMVAVLLHGPHEIVTQLWKDDCKVISIEKFNEIWHGILRSTDAGIWHKFQLEQTVTPHIVRNIMNSKYVSDNFNSGCGISLINDENYYQFDYNDEPSMQIGYEAQEDGLDTRIKYILPQNEDEPIRIQQFIKDYDSTYYHTNFEDVPIIHWQSYRAAKRWFEWGRAYINYEENIWEKHINGLSAHISVEQFDELINLPFIDDLLSRKNEAGWSETIEFETSNANYNARFYRANEDFPRSVMRFLVENDDFIFNFSLIKIGNTIVANDIDFYEDNKLIVDLIDEYYFEKVRSEFQNIFLFAKGK